MRLFLKNHFFLFSFNLARLRSAYGVCSYVPQTMRRLHYPLIDYDESDGKDLFDYMRKEVPYASFCYPSRHGFHAIVFNAMSFYETAGFLSTCRFADKNHVAIGLKRGYWFLEQRNQPIPRVFLEKYPLTFMRIERT